MILHVHDDARITVFTSGVFFFVCVHVLSQLWHFGFSTYFSLDRCVERTVVTHGTAQDNTARQLRTNYFFLS